MKAIQIHGKHDARYEDIPDPQYGPDEVLIRVKAAALCGTDLELYDGTMFYLTSGMAKLPLVPGHEWSGEVVAVGNEVDEFEPRDRVTGECSVGCLHCEYCMKGWYNQCPNRTETGILNRQGGMAELIAFPKMFLHKCNAMKYDEASFIEPTGIALAPTKITGVSPADYVAVFGPGPIGLFALQTAKAYGARRVVLIGTNPARLAIGRQLGADAVINSKEENLVERVREETHGHMIDVAIEAVGKPSVWGPLVSVLAPRARVGMTGLFAGERCQVDFDPLVINNISIYGSLGAPNMWGEAISLHERGLVTAAPMITHRLPLSDFTKGIDIMRNRTDNAVKVVLEP